MIAHPRIQPDDPWEAASWALGKVTNGLTGAKMLPIKLQHIKHQDVLSNFPYIIVSKHLALNVMHAVFLVQSMSIVYDLRSQEQRLPLMLVNWKPRSFSYRGSL